VSCDILYGRKSIAAHLNLTERQVHHLIQKGQLPTFKLGGMICATKRGLQNHFDRMMENAAELGRARLNPAEIKAELSATIVPLRRVAQNAGGEVRDDPATPLPVGLIERQASPKGRAPISGAGESSESNCRASGDPSTRCARHATLGSEGSTLSGKGRTASAKRQG
jgi:hypothetical protein